MKTPIHKISVEARLFSAGETEIAIDVARWSRWDAEQQTLVDYSSSIYRKITPSSLVRARRAQDLIVKGAVQ